MEFETRESNGILIVDIRETELDHTVCNDFLRRIKQLIAEGNTRILVNLEKVEFMDSCGIGTLITIRNQLMKEKGAIGMCSVNERVQKIIDVAALHKIFALYDTVDSALAEMAAS